jgi:signal transduction histidine kinase
MDLALTDIVYRDIEKRLAWAEDDERALCALEAAPERLAHEVLEEVFPAIASGVGSGARGAPAARSVEALEQSFGLWLEGLLCGPWDADYLARLRQVGFEQAGAGLEVSIATLQLLRARSGLVERLVGQTGAVDLRSLGALHKRLDLDMAVIHDAYAAARRRDLARSEQSIALQQVTGGVAHELRQPLNAIRTSAYYLTRARQLSTEKAAEHLRRIERQVEYADRMLAALSTFASLPPPAAAPLSLGESLAEALERNPLPDGVELSIEDLGDVPRVIADPGQLQIVFGNLLRNASDAMEGGGRLSVAYRHDQETVEIALSDTGSGIPAEALPHVLEPLFTTKSRGMGLGLAISSRILEALGGGIQLESEPGRGTTVTLRLRVATGKVQPTFPGKGAAEGSE